MRPCPILLTQTSAHEPGESSSVSPFAYAKKRMHLTGAVANASSPLPPTVAQQFHCCLVCSILGAAAMAAPSEIRGTSDGNARNLQSWRMWARAITGGTPSERCSPYLSQSSANCAGLISISRRIPRSVPIRSVRLPCTGMTVRRAPCVRTWWLPRVRTTLKPFRSRKRIISRPEGLGSLGTERVF